MLKKLMGAEVCGCFWNLWLQDLSAEEREANARRCTEHNNVVKKGSSAEEDDENEDSE